MSARAQLLVLHSFELELLVLKKTNVQIRRNARRR
jgi:hypothetical protein